MGVGQGQIKRLQEFAAEVARGLGVADCDFTTQRRIVELLDVQATLTVENGKKVAYVSRWLGQDVCALRPVPLVVK